MYTLNHDGEKVGSTQLERGDPETHSVSGVFNNLGGSKALTGWIKSIGGAEDDGVVFVVLNNDFELINEAGEVVKFEEGNLIAVPEEDEVYLDITGLSKEDYKTYFAEHLSAMSDEG